MCVDEVDAHGGSYVVEVRQRLWVLGNRVGAARQKEKEPVSGSAQVGFLGESLPDPGSPMFTEVGVVGWQVMLNAKIRSQAPATDSGSATTRLQAPPGGGRHLRGTGRVRLQLSRYRARRAKFHGAGVPAGGFFCCGPRFRQAAGPVE